MKQIYLILILFLSITSCKSLKNGPSSEIDNNDIVLFEKGVSIFEVIEETSFDYELKEIDTTSEKGKIQFDILTSKKEDILDYATEQFTELITKYPQSKLYHKALYNLAHINSILEYEKNEIKYLKMILASNANDKEKSGRSGLMSNPYANFKNEASSRLTEIYIKEKDFNKALEYAELNKKYPLQHFCGNAHAADEINHAHKYGEIYNGLGETQKSLDYLLPKIFNNGLASNSELIKLTYDILSNNYDLKYLKNEFDNSIKNYYSRKDKDEEWNKYFIKFLNVEIEILNSDFLFDYAETKDKSEIISSIKKSEFYLTLNK